MKPIEIPSIDEKFEDERIFVPFSLPVKGKPPIVFKVPRWDYVPAEDVKTIQWLTAELDFDASKIDALVADVDAPGRTERAALLLALKPFVSVAVFKRLAALPLGPLRFIARARSEQSSTSVGEYWASANSSTSSEGPSNTTSSPAVGDGSTLGDD